MEERREEAGRAKQQQHPEAPAQVGQNVLWEKPHKAVFGRGDFRLPPMFRGKVVGAKINSSPGGRGPDLCV